MTDDPIMRAVIHAKQAKRRHGWKTSAEPVRRITIVTTPAEYWQEWCNMFYGSL